METSKCPFRGSIVPSKEEYSKVEKIDVKFRTWFKGIAPRPTKFVIPGWAGSSNDYGDGAIPQPWHCQPFIEGSTYGMELVYPFDNECKVTFDGTKINFEGNFTGESPWEKDGVGTPPFASFAPGHYGFTSSLDLEPPEGYVTRLEPHPRFYTDEIGDVPLAIAGHIQRWWSRIFFVVFKAPWPSQTHIFRKNEPYAQVLFVPKKSSYNLVPMSAEEASKRSNTETNISTYAKAISKKTWQAEEGKTFDDKYKQLMKSYNKDGQAGIDQTIREAANKSQVPYKSRKLGRYVKIKGRNEVSEVPKEQI